jgi:hypothetical protein
MARLAPLRCGKSSDKVMKHDGAGSSYENNFASNKIIQLLINSWTHNPKDKVLQNDKKKLSTHTMQQPRRLSSSTVMLWKPQVVYLFPTGLSSTFTCTVDMQLIFCARIKQ